MESEKIYRLENASITKALRVTFVQGEGTQERPCRLMWRFYLPDGRYIGEIPADGQAERRNTEGDIDKIAQSLSKLLADGKMRR